MTEEAGRQFMRLTRYENLTAPSGQQQGQPQPPLQFPCDETLPRIDLPQPQSARLKCADLTALLKQRATVRKYDAQALEQAELAYLLWATQGVKEIRGTDATRRTVPSAGARHAFDAVYLATVGKSPK